MSLAHYKNKIFLILQEMDRLHREVLKENRFYVDAYFLHYAITGIELVMRATNTAEEYDVSAELVSLTKAHTNTEEERLRKNLENIRYDMDSAGTVNLITGPGKIEHVRSNYRFVKLLCVNVFFAVSISASLPDPPPAP